MSQLALQKGETITIQSVGEDLDAARYQAVVEHATGRFGLNPSQVVVGRPIAAGLSGQEGLLHYDTHTQNIKQSGVRTFNFGRISSGGGF